MSQQHTAAASSQHDWEQPPAAPHPGQSSSSSCSCLIPPLTVEPFYALWKSLLPNQQYYSVFLSTGTCQVISNRRKPTLLPWILIKHRYGASATNTKGREIFSRKTPRSKGCRNTALFAYARPHKSQLTDLSRPRPVACVLVGNPQAKLKALLSRDGAWH